MTYKQLVLFYGTPSEAARRLGVTRAAVNVWRNKGIPTGRQAYIQILTHGKLLADRPETVPQ